MITCSPCATREEAGYGGMHTVTTCNTAVTVCYDQVVRTGIDNLRRERLVFDDIHRKLAKSLLVKKKEMAGVIAHTNHILESREKVPSLPPSHPSAHFPSPSPSRSYPPHIVLDHLWCRSLGTFQLLLITPDCIILLDFSAIPLTFL